MPTEFNDTPDFGYKWCDVCKGTGWYDEVGYSLMGPTHSTPDCGKCDGDGQVLIDSAGGSKP